MLDQLLSRYLELEHRLHHLVNGLGYRSCTGAAVVIISGHSISVSPEDRGFHCKVMSRIINANP